MAVTFDAAPAAKEVNGATSATSNAFTIAGDNRYAVVVLWSDTAISSISVSVGGQSGTLLGNSSETWRYWWVYGVKAPATGSQTASASWTTSATVNLCVLTLAGVDQTTPATTPISVSTTTSSDAHALAMTSAAGNLTVTTCICEYQTGWTSDRDDRVSTTYAPLDTGPGTANPTHTWSGSYDRTTVVGVDVHAASTVTDYPIALPDGSEALTGVAPVRLHNHIRTPLVG